MTVLDDHSTRSATGLTITPQSPTIGAAIGGVDLGADLADDVLADIRQALPDWKVLEFRHQPTTTEQHLAFASRFGDLEVHPFAAHKDGYPEVLAITHDAQSTGKENRWHSDVTWREQPSLGSVLRMVERPPVGGDTLFADMYAAFEGLPDAVKERVAGRTARHDFGRFKRGMRKNGATDEQVAEMEARYPNPHHPVIRTHPETGRKGIYVNAAFTEEIDGLDPAESAELLETLYRQASFPEYQFRLRWEPDTIVFWDNRSVQHYAVSDYYPSVRRVERVTIVGDTPYYDPAQDPGLPVDERFQGGIRRWSQS